MSDFSSNLRRLRKRAGLSQDALATDPNELLYPNQKRRSGGVSRLVDDDFFGKLTVVIWIVGFLLGLPAGS